MWVSCVPCEDELHLCLCKYQAPVFSLSKILLISSSLETGLGNKCLLCSVWKRGSDFFASHCCPWWLLTPARVSPPRPGAGGVQLGLALGFLSPRILKRLLGGHCRTHKTTLGPFPPLFQKAECKLFIFLMCQNPTFNVVFEKLWGSQPAPAA